MMLSTLSGELLVTPLHIPPKFILAQLNVFV
jgi:hypothetical protein